VRGQRGDELLRRSDGATAVVAVRAAVSQL
jgi:hypothetical protein